MQNKNELQVILNHLDVIKTRDPDISHTACEALDYAISRVKHLIYEAEREEKYNEIVDFRNHLNKLAAEEYNNADNPNNRVAQLTIRIKVDNKRLALRWGPQVVDCLHTLLVNAQDEL